MKRKFEIAFLAVLVVAALVFLVLTSGNESRTDLFPAGKEFHSPLLPKKETTIRNVTQERVKYTIRAVDGSLRTQEKTLAVGEIDRIKTARDLEIRFDRNEQEASYELKAGKPYSFRYDENNFLQIYEGSHGKADAVDLAPYVATPMNIVERMLEMADVDGNDVLYDIGCGDGRIVITAAKNFRARGVGIDIDPRRIKESRAGAAEAGVEDLVEFRLGDATKMDISQATVVTLYLLPESNALLVPQLNKLKPGAFVVSHNYTIPGWESKEIRSVDISDITGQNHTIYLYRR